MFGISGWGTVQIFLIICISLGALVQTEDLCADNAYSDMCHKLGENYYLIDTNRTVCIAAKGLDTFGCGLRLRKYCSGQAIKLFLLNWFEAERFCRRRNGFLANPRNAKELDNIIDYLLANNLVLGDDGVWLGGNDLGSEGTFYATENSELMPYARWRYTEPNNLGGDENCVHLWNYDGVLLMNDNGCTKGFFYLCQLRRKTQLDCDNFISTDSPEIEWIDFTTSLPKVNKYKS